MAVLTLDGQILKTCYIGDSGFVIFRFKDDRYHLHFEFEQQQWDFNFPYQLALAEYFGDDPYGSICQDF